MNKKIFECFTSNRVMRVFKLMAKCNVCAIQSVHAIFCVLIVETSLFISPISTCFNSQHSCLVFAFRLFAYNLAPSCGTMIMQFWILIEYSSTKPHKQLPFRLSFFHSIRIYLIWDMTRAMFHFVNEFSNKVPVIEEVWSS